MTAQVHERLIIDGQEFTMAYCPPLPLDSGDIVEVTDDATTTKELGSQRIVFSTACWRGYIGTWEIKDGQLYLNEIVGRYRGSGNEPLPAKWFSGVLRIPQGNVIKPINMGFASVFEKEIHIKIEKGSVVKQREIDNSSKNIDRDKLAYCNFPGSENKFEGDDF